ncbi:hypothetical protein, partial [Nocardia gipuzkoensis]|uniref:hypothetical protein n=1 Tax=Nocardia gipuzkoensis TaxID=2749991 RepID=UPI002458481A
VVLEDRLVGDHLAGPPPALVEVVEIAMTHPLDSAPAFAGGKARPPAGGGGGRSDGFRIS